MAAASLTNEQTKKLNDKLTQIIQRGFTNNAELEAKKKVVKELVDLLRSRAVCSDDVVDVYHTGSAYEKAIVGDNHDFDVFLFYKMASGRKWRAVASEEHPGWSYIELLPGSAAQATKPQHVNDNGRLSSLQVRKYIKSKIDTALTALKRQEIRIGERVVTFTRSEKGPSITLNVKCTGLKEFTIDLVVTIRRDDLSSPAGGKDDYVAKPFNKRNPEGDAELWRNSYSRQEKELLETLDRGNKCHREMLKLLKMMRLHSPQLRRIPSYCYKNLVLNMSTQGLTWTTATRADRFVDLIRALKEAFETANLPAYFNNEVNLLEDITMTEPKNLLQKRINRGYDGYVQLLEIIPPATESGGLEVRMPNLTL